MSDNKQNERGLCSVTIPAVDTVFTNVQSILTVLSHIFTLKVHVSGAVMSGNTRVFVAPSHTV
jgi:hypothetical protein